MRKKIKLVYGWGVNDVDYKVCEYGRLNGTNKQVRICPYYEDWRGILERCFSKSFQEKQPTYKGCTIDLEWKYLSNFIKWVDSQPNKDWQNCQPDKDLLISGNKHYSPETVVYITKKLNSFITDSAKARGMCMLGVVDISYKNNKNPYEATCRNPFLRAGDYIGTFPTELEAHKAWQAKKHEYACQLADLQQDPRVAKALRERYAPDKDWTNK